MVSLHGNDPLPERVQRRGTPVVLGGKPNMNSSVEYVDVDNIGGARSAVQHLAAGGRRAMATISGPLDMGAGVDRLQGYHDGLRDAGLPIDPPPQRARGPGGRGAGGRRHG